jgi:hypothetical protein
MRASDLARLSEPYPDRDGPRNPGPMSTLGVDIPSWTALASTILGDLTEQFPYGIGWWVPHPGAKRRILISDQLYACAISVSSNMAEAGLHWLEFLDWAERESDRRADVVKLENGQLSIAPTSPLSPLEELGDEFVRMHVAGVVRALAGALDCLAGTIIGVLALPTKILLADFNKVRSRLKGITDTSTDGSRQQAQFRAKFEDLIASVGPKGWLEWTLAFRNMIVHRGRRLELGQFVPGEPTLYGPDARRILRARRVTHLPRDPGQSDVEVFFNSPQNLVLSEDAPQTLKGLLESTRRLINSAANDLTDLWNWRRAHPQSLPQPEAQWPDLWTSPSIGFGGYAPGTVEFPTRMIGVMHPNAARRFGAAALDDKSRSQWDSFD